VTVTARKSGNDFAQQEIFLRSDGAVYNKVPKLKIPLFTSIPPRITRISPAGSERGPQYQEQCISSWKLAGFSVFSLNSRRETLPTLDQEVSFIRIPGDSAAVTGKPLIFIRDLFSAIRAVTTSSWCVIVNSDILLSEQNIHAERLQRISRGSFVAEPRFDIPSIDEPSRGQYSQTGFDLFAFNIEDFQGEGFGNLVFGMPWWDHYVPLVARFKRLKRIRLPNFTAYHLEHTERWNPTSWETFGDEFLGLIKNRGDKTPCFERYVGRLRQRVERSTFVTAPSLEAKRAVKSVVKQLLGLPVVMPNRKHERLLAMSDLNVSFINEEPCRS
jgi:hypothetical protein